MTKAEVRYWLENRLINPQKDDRGYNSFSIEDLRNALLIKLLAKEHGAKLIQAAGCLYRLAHAELHDSEEKRRRGRVYIVFKPDCPRKFLLALSHPDGSFCLAVQGQRSCAGKRIYPTAEITCRGGEKAVAP